MAKVKRGKKKAGKSSDFTKRKNKLGKGKRPAENATAVTFKSRSIVVPSQLTHVRQDQPTGKRKLGLEALLRHLNHFKPSMRSDGLTGLRELFQDHPHLVLPNLALLLSPVLGKLIDSEPSVRHSLLTLLPTLLSQVSSHNIRAHFDTVVAHLSCGLTHISDKTRLDSLKLFQLLFELYPFLLRSHAQRLLPLLCGLVSQQKGSSSAGRRGGGGIRGGGRRREVGLAHDPHSKLSKVSSRLRVFSLLSRYMESLIPLDSSTEENSTDDSSLIRNPPLVDLDQKQLLIEQNGELVKVASDFCNFSGPFPCVMPLQRQGLLIKLSPSSYSVGHFPASCEAQSFPFSDVPKFIDFTEGLISLLFDCWSECGQVHSKTSKEMFQLKETILYLLYLTFKLSEFVDSSETSICSAATTPPPLPRRPGGDDGERAEVESAEDFLRQKFAVDFYKYFLPSFPLRHSSITTSSSSSSGDNQFFHCIKMNLWLSYVIVRFSRVRGDFSGDKGLEAVCRFFGTLPRVFNGPESIPSQILSECASVIADMLPPLFQMISGRGRWVESRAVAADDDDRCVENLLKGVSGFYEGCHSRSTAKKCLILCFHRLLETSSSDSSLVFVKLLQPWLDSLPQLLLELDQSCPPLSSQILHTLTSATPHISPSNLEQHLLTILGSGVLSQMSAISQRRCVELLWHVPLLSPHLLGVVADWVWSSCRHDNSSSSSSVAAYVVEIIHHWFMRRRSECFKSEVERATRYLIFMMGVVIGNVQSGDGRDGGETLQFDGLHECEGNNEDWVKLQESHFDASEILKIVDVVCECVRCTPFSGQVLDLVSPTIQSILEAGRCVSIDVAIGLLHFVHCLSSSLMTPSGIPQHLVLPLTRLCYPLHRRLSRKLPSQVGVATTMEVCRQVMDELMRSSSSSEEQILLRLHSSQ